MIHFTHKSTQSFARCWILLICAVWIFSSVHVSPAADLSGEWQGRWESFPTGHKGPLRATFTRLDEHSYRADFSGRFWMLLPFRYSVVLDVVEEGDVVKLAGSSYLGRLLGTFHYSAESDGATFNASYWTCQDEGVWCLERCCAAKRCCE